MTRLSQSPLFRCVVVAFLLAALPACSLFKHHSKDKAAPAKARVAKSKPNGNGLAVEMKVSPDPVKLGEVRQIDVTFTLRNVSKNMATLKFNSTQLIEILLRDVATDKIVSQWSTDRTFTQDMRNLVVNPQERLEYNEPITTRELKAGKPYNLEAYFVGYDRELRATKVIIPQP